MNKIELPLTEDGEIDYWAYSQNYPIHSSNPQDYINHYEAITAHEREQCAKVGVARTQLRGHYGDGFNDAVYNMRQAIRERGGL